jgi:hypothetical protein
MKTIQANPIPLRGKGKGSSIRVSFPQASSGNPSPILSSLQAFSRDPLFLGLVIPAGFKRESIPRSVIPAGFKRESIPRSVIPAGFKRESIVYAWFYGIPLCFRQESRRLALFFGSLLLTAHSSLNEESIVDR